MRIYNSKEMRKAEHTAVENGSTYEELMERAGKGVAQHLLSHCSEPQKTLILCGKGNNGGDGLVIARYLQEKGWTVDLFFLMGHRLSELAEKNLSRLNSEKISVYYYEKDKPIFPPIETYNIIIDGVFGTGFSGGLPEDIQKIFSRVNTVHAQRIALDIASGLNCDTGEISPNTFLPNRTYTFGAYKPAHVMKSCSDYCQNIELIDIGI